MPASMSSAEPRPDTLPDARHTYIALLRGINVGGRTIIKMDDLRAQFEAIGLADVVTYIQTGNVVFSSQEASTERLARLLEEQLASGLGYAGTVFVLTPSELKEAADANPFDPERHDREQLCHVMFLSREPDPARRDPLMALQGDEYRFAVRDRVLYYAYPRARAGARRTIDFEKVLGVVGTARTWKVVARLVELSEATASRRPEP